MMNRFNFFLFLLILFVGQVQHVSAKYVRGLPNDQNQDHVSNLMDQTGGNPFMNEMLGDEEDDEDEEDEEEEDPDWDGFLMADEAEEEEEFGPIHLEHNPLADPDPMAFDEAMGDELDDEIEDMDGCNLEDMTRLYDSCHETEKVDFLIVGCGIAGINAAKRIEEVNKILLNNAPRRGRGRRRATQYTYKCVEMDDLVGGRTRAAAFLPGKRNPLLEYLVDEMGGEQGKDFAKVNFDSNRNFNTSGVKYKNKKVKAVERAFEKALKCVRKQAREFGREEIRDRSLREALKECDWSEPEAGTLNETVEWSYLDWDLTRIPDKLGLYNLPLTAPKKDVGGGDFYLKTPRNAQYIAEDYAQDVMHNILTGTEVTKIDWGSYKRPQVYAVKADGSCLRFNALRVLVTTSLGVLHRRGDGKYPGEPMYCPNLPRRKMRALRNLYIDTTRPPSISGMGEYRAFQFKMRDDFWNHKKPKKQKEYLFFDNKSGRGNFFAYQNLDHPKIFPGSEALRSFLVTEAYDKVRGDLESDALSGVCTGPDEAHPSVETANFEVHFCGCGDQQGGECMDKGTLPSSGETVRVECIDAEANMLFDREVPEEDTVTIFKRGGLPAMVCAIYSTGAAGDLLQTVEIDVTGDQTLMFGDKFGSLTLVDCLPRTGHVGSKASDVVNKFLNETLGQAYNIDFYHPKYACTRVSEFAPLDAPLPPGAFCGWSAFLGENKQWYGAYTSWNHAKNKNGLGRWAGRVDTFFDRVFHPLRSKKPEVKPRKKRPFTVWFTGAAYCDAHSEFAHGGNWSGALAINEILDEDDEFEFELDPYLEETFEWKACGF